MSRDLVYDRDSGKWLDAEVVEQEEREQARLDRIVYAPENICAKHGNTFVGGVGYGGKNGSFYPAVGRECSACIRERLGL